MKTIKCKIRTFGWNNLMKLAFLMPIWAILFAQCYKDEGNYDYTQLDGINIVTTGINTQYAVTQFDILRIAPKVWFNGVEAKDNHPLLEFSWVAFPSGSISDTTIPRTRRDTLANTIALDVVIGLPTTSWTLLFTVTHKETGVKEFATFSVVVDGAFTDGWMVLYERDGNTDIGLISNDWIRTVPDVPNVYFTDILLSINGARLSGKPVAVAHPLRTSTKDIVIASENDMIGVNRQTFLITRIFEDFFRPGFVPATRSISWFGNSNGAKETLINNNGFHSADFSGMMGGNDRNNVGFLSSMVGDYGQLARWCSRNISSNDGVVYDQTNQRFLVLASGGFQLVSFVAQTNLDVAGFDVNNVGMEMLFSDFGRGNGGVSASEYSIMKNGAEYALLVSNFIFANPNTPMVGVRKCDMTFAPGIADITSIAPGFHAPFIYYSDKTKVRMFWWDNDATPFREAWTAPTGEEITAVRLQTNPNQWIADDQMANNWGVIYIATWDGQEGKVYSYKVDPNIGVINTSEERKYAGFGKIKDMASALP